MQITRYILNLSIMDHTGHIWITAFNDVAEQLLGVPANDLVHLKVSEPLRLMVERLPTEDRWVIALLDETIASTTADLERLPLRRGDPAAARLQSGASSATGTSNSSRPGSATRSLARSPSACWPPCSIPLPAAAPDHAVPDRADLAAAGPARPAVVCPVRPRGRASVCIAAWPSHPEFTDEADAERPWAQWQEKIQAIRNLRAERNVAPGAKIAPIIVAEETVAERLRQGEAFLKSLTECRLESPSARPPAVQPTRPLPCWPTPRSSCRWRA